MTDTIIRQVNVLYWWKMYYVPKYTQIYIQKYMGDLFLYFLAHPLYALFALISKKAITKMTLGVQPKFLFWDHTTYTKHFDNLILKNVIWFPFRKWSKRNSDLKCIASPARAYEINTIIWYQMFFLLISFSTSICLSKIIKFSSKISEVKSCT